jgi:hypothetical protein
MKIGSCDFHVNRTTVLLIEIFQRMVRELDMFADLSKELWAFKVGRAPTSQTMEFDGDIVVTRYVQADYEKGAYPIQAVCTLHGRKDEQTIVSWRSAVLTVRVGNGKHTNSKVRARYIIIHTISAEIQDGAVVSVCYKGKESLCPTCKNERLITCLSCNRHGWKRVVSTNIPCPDHTRPDRKISCPTCGDLGLVSTL